MYSQTRRTAEDKDVMIAHHMTRPSQSSSASSSHPFSGLDNSISADVVGGSVVGGGVVDMGGTSESRTEADPMRCDSLRNMNGLLTERQRRCQRRCHQRIINGEIGLND